MTAVLQALRGASDAPWSWLQLLKQKPDPGAFLARLVTQVHFPLYTTFLVAMQSETDFTALAHSLGLRYQDIEWFSRAAMLKVILQVCLNQLCIRKVCRHV